MTVPAQSPAIPVTPQEIIEEGIRAHEAGAAVIHVHVRDPETGAPSADLELFEEVLSGLRERCDAVLQPTTGGGAGMTIEERVRVVDALAPEMATLNAGSMNFAIFRVLQRPLDFTPWEREYLDGTRDFVFKNTFADMKYVAGTMLRTGTRPEVEIYDVGHLYNLAYLIEEGLVEQPFHMQFVLGVMGANQAELDQLLHMLRTAERLFGDGFTWSAAGVGYPAEFELAAASLMLGGHVRVGLEDNLRVRPRELAGSNTELVKKAAELARLFDRELATPTQVREKLGLKGGPEL